MCCACVLSEENLLHVSRAERKENKQTMDMHTTTMKNNRKISRLLEREQATAWLWFFGITLGFNMHTL